MPPAMLVKCFGGNWSVALKLMMLSLPHVVVGKSGRSFGVFRIVGRMMVREILAGYGAVRAVFFCAGAFFVANGFALLVCADFFMVLEIVFVMLVPFWAVFFPAIGLFAAAVFFRVFLMDDLFALDFAAAFFTDFFAAAFLDVVLETLFFALAFFFAAGFGALKLRFLAVDFLAVVDFALATLFFFAVVVLVAEDRVFDTLAFLGDAADFFADFLLTVLVFFVAAMIT